VERILNETTIVDNFVERYLSLAQGHFDEVFVKEFVSDDGHKRMLLDKGKRARQKQIVLADVVFGHQSLSKECYDALEELVQHTQGFWHDIRCAVLETAADREIGEQQPLRKAAAESHFCRMMSSTNVLSDRQRIGISV